jgi:hypothetical protein
MHSVHPLMLNDVANARIDDALRAAIEEQRRKAAAAACRSGDARREGRLVGWARGALVAMARRKRARPSPVAEGI